MGYVCKILVLAYFVSLSVDLHSQTWRRFYWIQIEKADNQGDIAVANSNLDGEWNAGLNYSGGQFTVGNLVLNADQPVGAGQDNYVFTYDHAAGEISLEPSATSGGFSSFDLQADAGFNETIGDGDVMVLTGGTGIDTETSNPDEVTFDLDFSELSVELTTDAADYFVLWDSGSGAEEIATSATVEEWIEDNLGNNVIQAGSNVGVSYSDAGGTITISATDTQLSDEQVQDIVGAMVNGNTESGITVTYQDLDGTLDFVVSGGGMTGFDWGSDSGNTSITDGETIRVLGSSNGIDVTGTGNDKTVGLDFGELAVELTTDAADYFVLWDSGTGAEEIATSATVEEWIEDNLGNNVIQAGANVSVSYSDAGGTITINATDTDTQLSNEQVQDIIGAMVSGNTESGITVTYQDIDGTLDFAVSGGGMSSWTWGGDVSTTSITDGETVRVQAETGLDAVLSGNTVTVSYDLTELTGLTGLSTLDRMLIYDQSAVSHKYVAPTAFFMMNQENVGAAVFDNRSAAPTALEGGVYYDTDDDRLKLYTGSAWEIIPTESDENYGIHTGMTNAAGLISMSHTLGVIPGAMLATAHGDLLVTVAGATSSAVTWRVHTSAGVLYTSSSVAFSYQVKK